MQIFSYRSEIDGLRALAIIPVMIFQAGFSFFDRDFLIPADSNLDDTFTDPNFKNLLVMGYSDASDVINIIKVKNYLQDYEMVKPQYNCFNYDEINHGLTL